MRSIKILLMLFLYAIGIFRLGEPQTPEWKGKIETKNGVSVIRNPKDPIFGEIVLDLKEDLSIGNENDENYLFYQGSKLTVDDEGNIFVLDNRNYRIQKYNKHGIFLQSIGKKGQGPGEFQSLNDVFIDAGKNLLISQGRSLSVFDKNGKFTKSVPFETSIYSFGIASEGKIIATTSSVIPGKISDDLIIFDAGGRRLKNLATYPNNRVVATGGVALGARNIYAPYLYFCPLDEGKAIYGFSQNYEIFKIDSSGNIILIIERDDSPEPITKQEKASNIDSEIEYLRKKQMLIPRREIENAYPFPAHKPFFYGLNTDDLGNIYVGKISPNKMKLFYDLFDKRGLYIYKVTISESIFPMIFRDGGVYTMSEDKESGFIKVKRYRIENWKRIKDKS